MNKITEKKPRVAVSPINNATLPVPGPGRPKGAKNKIPKSLKESFLEVYEMLGGTKGLYQWASKSEKNRAIYYQIVSKLLPQELEHGGQFNITIHRIISEKAPEDD